MEIKETKEGVVQKYNLLSPGGILRSPNIKEIREREEVKGVESSGLEPPEERPKGGLISRIKEKNEKALQQIVESINRFMEEMQFNLRFKASKTIGPATIQVINSEGKIIRQIPIGKLESIAKRIEEGAFDMGLLISGDF